MGTDTRAPDPEAMLTAAVGSIADFGNAVGTRWRHIKRGGTYKIVGSCRIEAVNEPAYLYQDEVTGIIWARPMDEFLDGRFEQIEGPWAAKPATCNEGLQVGDDSDAGRAFADAIYAQTGGPTADLKRVYAAFADNEKRRMQSEFAKVRTHVRAEALEEAAALVTSRRGSGDTDLRSIAHAIRALITPTTGEGM